MEGGAVDIERLAIGLDAVDRPGTGAKPQVFNDIAQLFITLGRQFGHGHAFLHVRVITLQLLELQGMTRQRLDQFTKTLIPGMQAVIAGVELLALGIIDAQVERIAVDFLVAGLYTVAEVFKGLQPLEARQAANHWQDARVERAHQIPRLLETERPPPERKQFDQLVDEVLARLTGKGHYRHRAQFEAQIVAEQQNPQHQRGRLACARPGDHRGRGGVAEDHLPLGGAGLGVRRQQPGNVSLHALLQFCTQWQAPVVEQIGVDTGRAMLGGA
ncbi:hypothetical protein D3C87_1299730 [compost metagenome]